MTLKEALDALVVIELAAHAIMTRWQDGVPPELREEIMLEIYQPALAVRLRYGRPMSYQS